MNHRLKTRILKTLSILPDSLGYFFYHLLQNIGSNKTFEYKIQSTQQSYITINTILQKNNIKLENLKIAELGSGWLPILPYLFVLKGGINEVLTYDINEHYNAKKIKKVNDYYKKEYVFEIEKKGKYELHSAVNYYPKTNICNGNLKQIGLVVSRFVLEHVPLVDIRIMHSFFKDQLKSGSYILHLISPSDHRAYSDSSLSLQDFLKYSEEEWNEIQTKFDYHNRLRLPHYLELFEKEFEIVYVEHDILNTNSIAYAKFKELVIHEDFSKFNDKELMAGSINILLRKR